MIKELIHQEDITIINIYASNIRASKYIKQTSTEVMAKIDPCNNSRQL